MSLNTIFKLATKESPGYRMPGEWETHERTLISWPVRDSMVWPENYEEFCRGFAQVVEAILPFEPVTLLVNEKDLDIARSYCGDGPEYILIPHEDAWVRDNGPTVLVDDQEGRLGISWKFNAWGEKYFPFDLDDRLAGEYLRIKGMPMAEVPLILEGGSIHSDGEGTILTTEECLLNPNRNKDMSREEIASTVLSSLGAKTIIWLEKGLEGDATDGHVDNIACFAAPGVVLLQSCEDPGDANYAITRRNLEILEGAVDASGRKLQVILIPQPPRQEYRGERLTLSYLNFYFVNQAIILPVFGGTAAETDAQAIAILTEVFPDRRIIPVDGMALVKEGGNVHCVTQQIPAGKQAD